MSKGESSGSKLGLPRKYDKRYRINISIPPRDVNTFLRESRGKSLYQILQDTLSPEQNGSHFADNIFDCKKSFVIWLIFRLNLFSWVQLSNK